MTKQPISTAPKDGTWFIAYQDGEPYPCQWQEPEPDGEGGCIAGGWLDLFNHSVEEPTEWVPVVGAAPENTPAREHSND